MKRIRKCDFPPPQNGGKECLGSDHEIILCNLRKCEGKTNLIEEPDIKFLISCHELKFEINV